MDDLGLIYDVVWAEIGIVIINIERESEQGLLSKDIIINNLCCRNHSMDIYEAIGMAISHCPKEAVIWWNCLRR